MTKYTAGDMALFPKPKTPTTESGKKLQALFGELNNKIELQTQAVEQHFKLKKKKSFDSENNADNQNVNMQKNKKRKFSELNSSWKSDETHANKRKKEIAEKNEYHSVQPVIVNAVKIQNSKKGAFLKKKQRNMKPKINAGNRASEQKISDSSQKNNFTVKPISSEVNAKINFDPVISSTHKQNEIYFPRRKKSKKRENKFNDTNVVGKHENLLVSKNEISDSMEGSGNEKSGIHFSEKSDNEKHEVEFCASLDVTGNEKGKNSGKKRKRNQEIQSVKEKKGNKLINQRNKNNVVERKLQGYEVSTDEVIELAADVKGKKSEDGDFKNASKFPEKDFAYRKHTIKSKDDGSKHLKKNYKEKTKLMKKQLQSHSFSSSKVGNGLFEIDANASKELNDHHNVPQYFKKKRFPQYGDNADFIELPKTKEQEEEVLSRTLFVGNLPLNATAKSVKTLFNQFGPVETVRFRGIIPVKPTIPRKVAAIQKEYHSQLKSLKAFVTFLDRKCALDALSLNGKLCDGHHIIVDLAHCSGEKKLYDKNQSVFIGNLPYTVEDETVWTAFAKCGTVDCVRIVRDKETGTGKGFGYVKFKSADSKETALQLNDLKIDGRTIRIKSLEDKKSKNQTSNDISKSFDSFRSKALKMKKKEGSSCSKKSTKKIMKRQKLLHEKKKISSLLQK